MSNNNLFMPPVSFDKLTMHGKISAINMGYVLTREEMLALLEEMRHLEEECERRTCDDGDRNGRCGNPGVVCLAHYDMMRTMEQHCSPQGETKQATNRAEYAEICLAQMEAAAKKDSDLFEYLSDIADAAKEFVRFNNAVDNFDPFSDESELDDMCSKRHTAFTALCLALEKRKSFLNKIVDLDAIERLSEEAEDSGLDTLLSPDVALALVAEVRRSRRVEEAAGEVERLHVREWQDSIVRHEQKRDEEARLRDALECRAEIAERERDEARAQRDNILDAHAEGSWMARALDAEGERDKVRSALAEAQYWRKRHCEESAQNGEQSQANWLRAARAERELDAAWEAASVPVRGMVELSEVITDLRSKRTEAIAARDNWQIASENANLRGDVWERAYGQLAAEVSRLRRIEEAARDVATISLNDAGPEAFHTMTALRAALKNDETP